MLITHDEGPLLGDFFISGFGISVNNGDLCNEEADSFDPYVGQGAPSKGIRTTFPCGIAPPHGSRQELIWGLSIMRFGVARPWPWF